MEERNNIDEENFPVDPKDIFDEVKVEEKKLCRSRKNRIFLGVCAGIAEYWNIDPIFIRIIFILTILIGGWGAITYLIAAWLIPVDIGSEQETEQSDLVKRSNSKVFFGSVLILTGFFFIFDIYGIVTYFSFLGIPPGLFWPAAMIGMGSYLFANSDNSRINLGVSVKFKRSNSGKKFMGVCAGLADYLNADSNLIRMLWIIFTFITLGLGALIYFIISLTVPVSNDN